MEVSKHMIFVCCYVETISTTFSIFILNIILIREIVKLFIIV